MVRRFAILVIMLAAVGTVRGIAQVAAAVNEPLKLFGYGDASGALREEGYGKALGYGAGLTLERSHWLALDGRGVVLRERIPLHTYIIEAGPRVSYKFGPLTPYGEVMGGYGRSGYFNKPKTPVSPLRQAYGFTYTLDGGVDLRLKYRFSWRVADFTYNHISVPGGVTPIILSTGVVYHIF